MNHKIKVSLIIPIYNMESYLKTALDSAINQTLKDIEIICINDGSTDNSINILNSYAKKDSRIKIINQHNQGLSITRNKGIENAKGGFLAFLDSDDTLELNALESLYNCAIKNASLIVIGHYRKTYLDGKQIVWKSSLGQDIIRNYLNGHIGVPACNKLYSNQMITNNHFKFAEGLYHEDDLSTLELLYFAEDKISIVDKVVYNYKVREGSISATFRQKHANDLVEISVRKKEFLIKKMIFNKYKQALFFHTMELLKYYLRISADEKNEEKIITFIFNKLALNDIFNKNAFLLLKKERLIIYNSFIFLLLKWCKNIKNFDVEDFFSRFFAKEDIYGIKHCMTTYNTPYGIIIDFLISNNIKEIAIYGAGELYLTIKSFLDKNNIKINFLMDLKAKNKSYMLNGIEVLYYKEALIKYNNQNIISTMTQNIDIITKELEDFCKDSHKNHKIIDLHYIENNKNNFKQT